MGRPKRMTAFAPTMDAGPQATPGDGPIARISALQIGARLGQRYDIVEYLGEGGMGAVYRAHDRVLKIDVALKSLRGSFATGEQLREEVRVAQQVTHPNVCRIYDLVEIDNLHFIKMECIAGETLATRLAARGAFDVAETLRIARGVVAGLEAAHARSIVHRDLKPGNIMLAGERVVLMDFGLALAITGGAHDRAGTPSYMSPEQIAGERLDATSDLFALGCLVFEMLVGRRAFEHTASSYSELVKERAQRPMPDIVAAMPKVPRWLVRAVELLIAIQPAQRRRGLALLVHGPRRGRTIALAAAATLAATGAVVWAMQPEPVWQPEVEELLPYSGNGDSPALSPDGTKLLINQDVDNASRWTVSTMPATGGALTQISPRDHSCLYARWSRDGASALMGCHFGTETKIVRVLVAGPNGGSVGSVGGGAVVDLGAGVQVDDCGDALAIIEEAWPRTWRLVLQGADGARRTLLEHTSKLDRVRCTPGGDRVAVVAMNTKETGTVVMVGRDGKREDLVDGALDIAFTKRSLLFVTTTDGRTTRLEELDLRTRARRTLLPTESRIKGISVSSAGDTLLFHRDITWTPIWEARADGERASVTPQQESIQQIAPIPGTERQLVGVRMVDVTTTEIVRVDAATQSIHVLAQGASPIPSRDGKHVYFATLADPQQLVMMPLVGGEQRAIAKLPGKLIAGVDDVVGLQVVIATDKVIEDWIVTSDGTSDARLQRSPFGGPVVTAPSGGWRAIALREQAADRQWQIALVPPDQPLSNRDFVVPRVNRPVWVDDHRISYCDPESCLVLDVTTRQRERGPRTPMMAKLIAAGLDGKRWFYSPVLGRVSLHRIDNFSAR